VSIIPAMRIFLSYPSQDRQLVESIYLALRAQGHSVFFDRDNLPPGEEYHIRIRNAIEKSDLFVFMMSPDAFDAGSYTLTELEIAKKTWDNPAGRVLPVMLRPVALDKIPAYLESVTFLEPDGNMAATVADAVHRITLARRKTLFVKSAMGLAAALVAALGVYSWYTHRQPAQEVTAKDGAPAVLVPAGAFTMGDDKEEPLRQIYVDAFYIDKYEITTARYARFLQATGSVRTPEGWDTLDPERGKDLAVVGVSWRDADAYCHWAGKRLPTEAEWEKAGRGTDARAYPWGNETPTAARAQFGQDATSPYKGGLAPVGSHKSGKSPYGVYDMAGNVSEWVADWYAEGIALGDARNPQGPKGGTKKVIRDGGWQEPASRLKSTKRSYASPDTVWPNLGFRCAGDLR